MRTWKLASIVAFGCLFVGMNASPARADGANAADDTGVQPRVEAESIFYARLGYGAIFTAQTQGVPSVGLVGYRHELDAFAVDMSFLNFAFANGSSPYVGSSSNASSGSWLKLEALRFARPHANGSGYAGGGLSWGSTSVENKREYSSGSGLQGELTVGYETARNSSIRAFIQADATLPFYALASTDYSYVYSSATARNPAIVSTSSHRYSPTLTISMGLGFRRR